MHALLLGFITRLVQITQKQQGREGEGVRDRLVHALEGSMQGWDEWQDQAHT